MTTVRGCVTASSSAAAEAGLEILDAGGNAVDAAVATALASCVADPCNTGLGGYGGHLVIGHPGSEPICLDFNMWVRDDELAPNGSGAGFGPAVAAIPNVVAGLSAALERFGSLTWDRISEPAHRLAEQGVTSNGTTLRAFAEIRGLPLVDECFLINPVDPEDGATFRFRQPALARTLEQMAARGPRSFYEGSIADAGCKLLQDAGRPTTRADWTGAPEAVIIEPASRFDVANATLHSAPLGTSGSASLFATLAAGQAVAREHSLRSGSSIRPWAEAIARSWSYRFGVPEGNRFADISIETWIGRALAFEVKPPIPASSEHTCHLNVAGADGTLVAMTLTHGPSWFGSRCVIPGTGIILNAGMHLLSSAPPVRKGGRSYAVTNMAPTIAEAPDARIAIGCPGGRRIPTNIGLVLARHLLQGIPLQEAVSLGRFHTETVAELTIEHGRWADLDRSRLSPTFDLVKDEDWRNYYGPLTAIRISTEGDVEFGLDDRDTPGFSAPG